MFKRILVLGLMICVAGCSGKKEKADIGDENSGLRGNVQLVSNTVPVESELARTQEEMFAQVAPDNCLVFAAWQGLRSQPGGNPADQLLENSQFTESIENMASCLSVIPFAYRGSVNTREDKPVDEFVLLNSLKQSPEMMKMLSASSGCAFFGLLPPENQGMPKMDAAIVFQLGDKADSFNQHLQNGFSPFGEPVESVEIRGLRFSKIAFEFDGFDFDLVLGTKDGLFIVGLGADSVEGVLSRHAAGKNPAWLANCSLGSEPWGEKTEYLMVDVKKTVAHVGELAPIWESMNVREVTTIEMSTGRTQDGVQHRLIINGGQKLRGIAAYKQVDFSKFDYIPDDAQVSMVYGLEPEKSYLEFVGQLKELDEFAYENFVEAENYIQQELDINVRKDVFANLGSNLSFHMALNDDLLGGMVFSVDIKNKAALVNVIEKLLMIVQTQVGEGEYYGPKLRLWNVGKHRVGSFIEGYFIVEPCWCITGERLIVALSPEAMRTSLAAPTAKPMFDAEFTKLFQRPSGVASGGNEKLVFAGYVDMKTIAQVVYPLVRAGFTSFKSNADQEFSYDPVEKKVGEMLVNMELPPLRTIVNGLGPGILAVRLNDNGLEYEFSHTLPVLTPVGSLATSFVCSLPAINSDSGSADGSADKTQMNLRQVQLACLNYEMKNGHFPTDEMEKIRGGSDSPLAKALLKAVDEINEKIFGPVEILAPTYSDGSTDMAMPIEDPSEWEKAEPESEDFGSSTR